MVNSRHCLLTIFLSFLFSLNSFSHKANEAFFTIKTGKGTIEIEAEFPWSIRQALLDFDSTLYHSKLKSDFENTFFNYVKLNLILTDCEGRKIQLYQITEVENKAHSHQNNFLFLYKGKNLLTVENTIMFSLHKNQTNYIFWQNHSYQTNAKKKWIQLPIKKTTQYYWLLLCFIPLFFFIKIKSKRKSNLA